MENRIIEIDVNEIFAHPQNPRLEIGDVEELAASILAKGILQNLTVVPLDEGYRCVIGHRRLNAARLAGLDTVPCVICHMGEKEQIETMLLENMQRSDLTIYEQAAGFQLMLDFGDSIEVISEKTGFSQSTIRRRVKLSELDQTAFKNSLERGATLMDYAELEKITDIKLRNDMLKFIGTNNFKWQLESVVKKEKWLFDKASIIEKLKEMGIGVYDENMEGLQNQIYVYVWSSWNNNRTMSILDELDADTEYIYKDCGDSINLYKIRTSSEINAENIVATAKSEQEITRRENKQKLDELSSIASELREEFMRNFWAGKKHSEAIMEFMADTIMANCGDFDDVKEDLYNAYGIESEPKEGEEFEEVEQRCDEALKAKYKENPLRFLALTTWYSHGCNGSYYLFNCQYNKNVKIDIIYDFLCKVGYKMSDDEIALREGSHELFANADT